MHPLTVLGDPVRRAILEELAQGELAAGEIVRRVGGRFDIGGSAVSQHLARLQGAGFVAVRPKGRQRHYRVDAAGFATAQAWLDGFAPFWNAALDRLGADLDSAVDAAGPAE